MFFCQQDSFAKEVSLEVPKVKLIPINTGDRKNTDVDKGVLLKACLSRILAHLDKLWHL